MFIEINHREIGEVCERGFKSNVHIECVEPGLDWFVANSKFNMVINLDLNLNKSRLVNLWNKIGLTWFLNVILTLNLILMHRESVKNHINYEL